MISKLVEIKVIACSMATVPRITVKSFHNQKPWITRNIRDAINTHIASYNRGLQSGNMANYKAAAYNVRRVVREAKGDCGKKVELKC